MNTSEIKKNNAQTKERQQAKIDFIIKSYPNLKDIDFITSRYYLLDLKQKLIDAGFYKAKNTLNIDDSAVIAVAMLAQGKRLYKKQSLGRRGILK